MKTTLLSSLISISVLATTGVANAATIGSQIQFSGFVFGSANQFDYIDSSVLLPSPNVLGNFIVTQASGSFAPALAHPLHLGKIRDVHEGISSGLITQSSPLFDGSNDPNLYVNDFISLSIPNLVDFSFNLETVKRVVEIDPNSPNPLDPLILKISSLLTGTLTDFITNEVQAAVGTFVPNIPPSVIPVSQLTPDSFLGPIAYQGSLRVVSVPESSSNAGLALIAGVGFTFMLRKKQS
jgi:hypothetical protein